MARTGYLDRLLSGLPQVRKLGAMAEVPFYTFEKTFPKGLFRQFKRNLVLIPKNNQ